MKKMLPWLITILLAIALIAVVAVFLFNQFFSNDSKDPLDQVKSSVQDVQVKKLSADKLVEVTAQISDIRTNLADTNFIVLMGFAFQLDKKATKEDFEKIKDIEIKPIIIRTLADMTPEQMEGSKGKDELTAKLFNLISPVLPGEGKLTKIEITDFIINRL